jgi:hypothetical protein
MIPDCRAKKSSGWLYFIEVFVPPLRWLVSRYGGDEAALHRLLDSLREFPDFEPMVERELMAALRPAAIGVTGWTGGSAGTLDLDAFETALLDLTLLERQIVWFETFGYDDGDAGRLCRVSPETARIARDRAGEMLRASLDSWTAGIVAANGQILADAARSKVPAEPQPFRNYIDIIDGRMTWQNRTGVDRSLAASWYEVDHFCRVREADAAMRETSRLDPASPKALPFLELFGVKPPRPPLWKRLLA